MYHNPVGASILLDLRYILVDGGGDPAHHRQEPRGRADELQRHVLRFARSEFQGSVPPVGAEIPTWLELVRGSMSAHSRPGSPSFFVAPGIPCEVGKKVEPVREFADSVCLLPSVLTFPPEKFVQYCQSIAKTFYIWR